MASTLTSEQVRSDLERARALLTKTEEDFHRGTVEYERLAAVQQELRFREGLLEAVTKREDRRRQEVEAEAARKIAEQKRRLEAEAALPVVEKRRTTAENFVSAALDIHDVFNGPEDNPVKVALSLVVDALDSEVHGGPGRGALDRIRQEILKPGERRKLEGLRKELAETKATLAATNGSHTKKGSVK